MNFAKFVTVFVLMSMNLIEDKASWKGSLVLMNGSQKSILRVFINPGREAKLNVVFVFPRRILKLVLFDSCQPNIFTFFTLGFQINQNLVTETLVPFIFHLLSESSFPRLTFL